ncbi:hypothetical protein J2853_009728 [Streptosporangium lutulentum]|uniref:AAA domain-containing protein n=1 Tax=Streptosporangium lutulentum TaxID=1461250 RepID=A0ABT9QUL2_9ACTN|nr:hypothetical protein [Streptosporangium lutulentum]
MKPARDLDDPSTSSTLSSGSPNAVLAKALAHRPRVLVVDCDPQPSASFWSSRVELPLSLTEADQPEH